MHSLAADAELHRLAFYVAVGIWAIPEWIGTLFQRSERGADHRDRGSHVVLLASMLFGVASAFVLVRVVPQATLRWQQSALFWIGITLILVGVSFRWYAIHVLGRFFTRDVATRAGQTVVDRGPYKIIRHPSYSGGLLSLMGFGLALTNWLSLLVLMVCALIGFSYRIRVEERALCDALGPAYRDYMKRTYRLIPYLW